MVVYLLLLFVLFFSSYKKEKTWFNFSVFLLIFVSSLRGIDVGTDTIHFAETYRMIKSSVSEHISSHTLFVHYYKLLFSLGLPYRAVMFITTLITVLPVTYVAKKTSNNPSVVILFYVLLGFYFHSFNVSRQMMAVSFVLLSYYFFVSNKYVYTVIFVVVAASFHTSSMITIPFFALRYLPLIKEKTVWMSLILLSYTIPMIVDLTRFSYLFFEVSSFERYAVHDGEAESIGRLPIYSTILSIIYLYLLYRNKAFDFIFRISILSLIFVNFLYTSPSYAMRITFYFTIAQVLFFANMVKKDKLGSYLIYGYSLLYFIHQFIIKGTDGIYPYYFSIE